MRVGKPTVDIFTISPRTTNEIRYWNEIREVVALSDQVGFSGVLCFAGNDTMIEPWLVAHHICATSRSLRPLVAANPMYMHPFTAAKMISSFSLMYGRQIDVNLIIGTSSVDHQVFNDLLSHDERYHRLTEYALVVKALLSNATPITFQGKYYALKDALIRPQIDRSLLPTFYVAGKSTAARSTAEAVEAIELMMLRPELDTDSTCGPRGKGVYLGIITRATNEEAWQIARDRYPSDREGERMLDFSMRYTEAKWKMQLKQELSSDPPVGTGYWLEPFKSFRADCPYFVGSHESVARLIASHARVGVRTFVIDIWPTKEEFQHVAAAFKLAEMVPGRSSVGAT